MEAKVDISIFVVNYNTRHLLRKCLQSICDSEGAIKFEVFVADNNSSDGSTQMVRTEFPEVSLSCHEQNLGYTRAVNRLLPRGTGEYYLLLHPDVELLPDTLTEFLEFFRRHRNAGILGGNLLYADGTPNPCEILFPGVKNDLKYLAVTMMRKVPFFKGTVERHDPTKWKHEATAEVMGVWNACMMFRREVLNEIGMFDERFFVWFADWDFCKRAREKGWSVYYVANAKALHHERFSFKASRISKEVKYKTDGWYSLVSQTRDRHTFLNKHNGKPSVFGVKAIEIAGAVLKIVLLIINIAARKTLPAEGSFRIRTCAKMIRVVLRA